MQQTSVASDTVVNINGSRFVREGNTITHEGITYTIGAEAAPEAGQASKVFDIEVKRDTTEMKERILTFVEEYNKLVKTLNELYRTERPRSSTTNEFFQPLTDEEKRGMSENEIKQWEDKAREGLLHRDPILDKLLRDMRMQLSEAVDLGNGRSLALSNLGITTTMKTADGGILEIKMEDLDKALEERADDIALMFSKSADRDLPANRQLRSTGLGDRLNNLVNGVISRSGSLTQKAGSEEWVSMEKNNMLYKEISANNDRLSLMMTTLRRKEEQYYVMFAKLESAMMKADSQMASLQGLLGMGQM